MEIKLGDFGLAAKLEFDGELKRLLNNIFHLNYVHPLKKLTKRKRITFSHSKSYNKIFLSF